MITPDEAYKRECKYCGAKPNEYCVFTQDRGPNARKGDPMTVVHKARCK